MGVGLAAATGWNFQSGLFVVECHKLCELVKEDDDDANGFKRK
jgi:hypothetical protein